MDGSIGISFWTVCHCCSFMYEYPNSCKDQLVVCARCRKPFRAVKHQTPLMPHGPLKLEKRLKIERDSKVSTWGLPLTVPKFEVKIEPKGEVKIEQPSVIGSGHVNKKSRVSGGESKPKDQKRKTRIDKGVKRDKSAIPTNMIRSALVEKSKSMIEAFTGRR